MIRAHELDALDRCKWCGAKKPGAESTCIARVAPTALALYPEPARRQLAWMCPLADQRSLYDCLRLLARCGETCPHRADWIGPQS